MWYQPYSHTESKNSTIPTTRKKTKSISAEARTSAPSPSWDLFIRLLVVGLWKGGHKFLQKGVAVLQKYILQTQQISEPFHLQQFPYNVMLLISCFYLGLYTTTFSLSTPVHEFILLAGNLVLWARAAADEWIQVSCPNRKPFFSSSTP